MAAKKRVPTFKPAKPEESVEAASEEKNSEETEAATDQKPKLSPAEAKALFVWYDTVLTQRRELEELVRQKAYECSAAVKDIAAKLGRGPFEWKGGRYTVVIRADSAFLKAEGNRDVLKIE